MARKTKVEAEKTRRKILLAALDLFVEKGYARATFEDVAARIRLTKGAVYWHFKSKSDLFAELVVDMTETHNRQMSNLLTDPVSLDGLTAHFVERARLVVSKPINRKYFKMMLSMDWPSAKFTPIKRRLRAIESNPFTTIERTLTNLQKKGDIRRDADICTAAAVLGSMWLGAMKLQIDKSLEADWSKAIRLGFSAVIDTIKA